MDSNTTLELIKPITFISYAKEDVKVATDLYQQLQKDNLYPWMDDHNLLPGEEWELVINKIIKQSRFVIVLISKHSINKKGYIQKEIQLALEMAQRMPEGDIYIIPIRIENCSVPERMSHWQWLDLFKTDGYNKLRLTLIHKLGKMYNPPKIKSKTDSKKAATFNNPIDYLAYDLFLEWGSFIYCKIANKKYAISDGRFMIIRKEIPKQFYELRDIVTRFEKIKKEIIVSVVPPESKWKNNSSLIRTIIPIENNTVMLTNNTGTRCAIVNASCWRLVEMYYPNAKSYLSGKTSAVVSIVNNEPIFLLMPIRTEPKKMPKVKIKFS